MSVKKIGLLGGSFNPAHEGHVYISTQAIDLLNLDEVWWLVAQQNPLKEKTSITFNDRLNQAKAIISGHNRIIVSDFEQKQNTTYSFDTIHKLKAVYSTHNFIWLMGADNFVIFDKWYKWQEIMQLIPLAVFNRGNLKKLVIDCKASREYANQMTRNYKNLMNLPPPVWSFIDIKPHHASSTKIRNV